MNQVYTAGIYALVARYLEENRRGRKALPALLVAGDEELEVVVFPDTMDLDGKEIAFRGMDVGQGLVKKGVEPTVSWIDQDGNLASAEYTTIS